jgi:nickel/cobalt transporter (NicO) family protein
MRKYKLFFLCLLIIFAVISIYMAKAINAQQNPFLSSKTHKSETKTKKINSKSKFSTVNRYIVPIQRKLNRKISYLSKRIETDKSFVLLLIFFSFIYGLVHAIGPGHGKFIISSYFFSKKAKPIEAVLSGFVIAFTHGISGIVIILVIFLLLHLPVLKSLANTTRIISIISYLMIAGIGLFLFVKAVIDAFTRKKPCTAEPNKSASRVSSFLPISFITGLIPCPGAATIILFSLSAGAFMVGAIAIFAMSLGMGLMISLFALAALYAQKGILNTISSKQAIQFKIIIGLRLIGAFMLFSIGLLLLSLTI